MVDGVEVVRPVCSEGTVENPVGGLDNNVNWVIVNRNPTGWKDLIQSMNPGIAAKGPMVMGMDELVDRNMGARSWRVSGSFNFDPGVVLLSYADTGMETKGSVVRGVMQTKVEKEEWDIKQT